MSWKGCLSELMMDVSCGDGLMDELKKEKTKNRRARGRSAAFEVLLWGRCQNAPAESQNVPSRARATKTTGVIRKAAIASAGRRARLKRAAPTKPLTCVLLLFFIHITTQLQYPSQPINKSHQSHLPHHPNSKNRVKMAPKAAQKVFPY